MSSSSPTTRYSALVATHTYTSSARNDDEDLTVTKTYVLAPQTTPFSRGANLADCNDPSVACNFDVSSVNTASTCSQYDVVNENGHRMEPDCYPDSYWNREWPHHWSFRGDSTLAYPGDSCPTRWTTACSVTLTLDDLREQIQTWCCPQEGDWSCHGGNPSSVRLCESRLNTDESVWASSTDSDGSRVRVITTATTDIIVHRHVFALGNFAPASSSSVESGSAIRTGGSSSETSGSGGDGDGDEGMSNGQVAGVAIGATLGGLLVLALLGFFFIRRRKQLRARRGEMVYGGSSYEIGSGEPRSAQASPPTGYADAKPASAHPGAPAAPRQGDGQGHAELYGYGQVPPYQQDAKPAEPGHQATTELSGESRVELPGDYGTQQQR